MSRRLAWVLALSAASTARADPGPSPPEAPAAGQPDTRARAAGSPIGGLHRAAAVIEATLDVHRLALNELAAAAHKIAEAGQQPNATPASALPASASEVLGRLSTSVPARVPSDALPAVARAYQAEATEALEDLGRASRLGDVVGPLRAYVNAVERLKSQAAEIIDIFSRARPVEMRVVDSDSVLDEVNEALDELARAEAGVSRLRDRHRPLGDSLQAFMRLEVALGHVLDLLAEAQEAGIHIGIEAPMSTADLAATLKATERHLKDLESALALMERPPRRLAGPLEALVESPKDEPPYEVRLSWTAPDPHSPPAALRVYRRADRQRAVHLLASALACESGDASAAAKLAEQKLPDDGTPRVLVAEIAPGRSSLSDTVAAPESGYTAPLYQIVPVSAFGVEGPGLEADAVLLPHSVEPPPLVQASLASTHPADPAFYRDADRVVVRWEPSPNELPVTPTLTDLTAWARQHELPVAGRYRVLRVSQAETREVGVVPTETHTFSDRPPIEALRAGIAYVVETLSDEGRASQEPEPCRQAEIQQDLTQPFAEAALGAAYVHHPTAVERRVLEALANPKKLHQALSEFAERPAPEREHLLQAWWTSLSVPARLRLLSAWPNYVPQSSNSPWLYDGVFHLSSRDRPWVVSELWLQSQPPFMQREIDRWWSLLDATAQAQSVARWRSRLDAAPAQWVDKRLAAGDETALRPARVLAWWQSRDASERERIEDWWLKLGPDERQRLYREWLFDEPMEVKLSLRWPDLGRRTEAERAELLAEGYRDLPEGLLPYALAWLAWHNLSGTAKTAAIAVEVPLLERWASAVRWRLRPLDCALGFHLWTVTASIAVLIALGLVARWVRQRERRRR